jgi:hypothetical protein
VDRAIEELAEIQQGMVARRQLLARGVSRQAIGHRLDCGRLHVVHRGIYAVGHRVIAPDGRRMAAVLFGGPGAVLSHRSAAELHGVRVSARSRTDVTIQAPRRQPEGAVQFHFGRLPEDEITTVRNIPVTSVSRTLFDNAGTLPRRETERCIHEAELKRLSDTLSLPEILARYPRRRGAPIVREILVAGDIGVTVPANVFEDAFLVYVEAIGLPRPETNVRLRLRDRWIVADLLWRQQRVLVELDGRAAHLTRRAFEGDRARDRAATVAGWRPVRITWAQFHGGPEALAGDLRALLQPASVALSSGALASVWNTTQ